MNTDQHNWAGGFRPIDFILILFGAAATLCIYGYRYGEGNHTVYLVDALRRSDPQLLRNDWFTTQTLQYHAVFGWAAKKLMQWRVIQPVFLSGYVVLVLMFHAAWLGMVRQLAYPRDAYLLSLVLYYASAAGTGLGFYQFFQDSSFLPSNIANVALLWGFYLWICQRPLGSAACFGVAGLFHLNHAIVGSILWIALWFMARAWTRRMLGASVVALMPSLINIALAWRLKIDHSGSMPFSEFVDLYVRLRHPHHYDPSSWPFWLWASFLWPMPFAVWGISAEDGAARRRLKHIFLLLLGLQIVALIGAGVWYLSETLVQLSLFRFSIFIQLFACIFMAGWIVSHLRHRLLTGGIAATVCAAMALICLLRGPFFGTFVMPEDDAEYQELTEWVRLNTPRDAVFLVPPSESSFRLDAQRSIVVNFKSVPQLSGELGEWRDRLCDALDLTDLRALPRGHLQTISAIRERYASLGADQLVSATRKYNARYVVALRPLARPDLRFDHSTSKGGYFMYEVVPRNVNE